jgi:hypothetical protein
VFPRISAISSICAALLCQTASGCSSSDKAVTADADLGSVVDATVADASTFDAADAASNPDAAGSPDAAIPDAAPLAPKRVFQTVAEFDGALGGLTGADAKCQFEADAAGLGGTWMAWLGDDSGNPLSRFTKSATGYALLDGTVIADSWSDLVDGSIDHKINITSDGAVVPTWILEKVWTNVTSSGTTHFAQHHCDGWTSQASMDPEDRGALGDPHTANAYWTEGSANGVATSCFFDNHLYCFEQ